jgi:hypothetical protein
VETFVQRMTRYISEYSTAVWPDQPVPSPNEVYGADAEHPDFGFDVLEVQVDGWSNAHVEGEHDATNCPYATSEECGERTAAESFVEAH